MLKQVLKVATIACVAGGLAIPAFADDAKGAVTGRAVATAALFSSSKANSSSKAVSYNSMTASARLGYSISQTEGDWTGTGYMESDWSATGSSTRDMWVALENKSIRVQAGRSAYLDLTYQGATYLDESTQTDGAYWTGSGRGTGFFNGYKISLLGTGLDIVVRLAQDTTAISGKTTDDTTIGANYAMSTDDMTILATVASISAKGSADLGSENYEYSRQMIAASFTKKIDTMTPFVNFQKFSSLAKTGTATAAKDGQGFQELQLGVDMEMDGFGVTGSYHTRTTDTEVKANSVTYNEISVGAGKTMAGVALTAGYALYSTKSDDTTVDGANKSVFGVTMIYNF